jgi:hypothetical protein
MLPDLHWTVGYLYSCILPERLIEHEGVLKTAKKQRKSLFFIFF